MQQVYHPDEPRLTHDLLVACIKATPPYNLPPLEPAAFLAWLAVEEQAAAVMSVPDFAWALGLSEREAHRALIGMAAFARKIARRERMGCEFDR